MSDVKFKITCPKCGSFNTLRERGLNGNDECTQCMATYPSNEAIHTVDKEAYDKLQEDYVKIVEANITWQKNYDYLNADHEELAKLLDQQKKFTQHVQNKKSLIETKLENILEKIKSIEKIMLL